MLNNVFSQKRNSMTEAERRRQVNLKKQAQMESDKRAIRSANSSPTTNHQFIMNSL